MDYINKFRDPQQIKGLANAIADVVDPANKYVFMEVCGTHTMAIGKFGIRNLLPDNVRLISGPGCPVCVTSQSYVDRAIALARVPDISIVTFGDMVRVPGSTSDLRKERAAGATIKIVYSPNEAVKYADANRETTVVFLGVGFETTTPTIAGSIALAERLGLDNYYVLAAHKLIPPALDALCSAPELKLNGFILPAHVSAIIGCDAYIPTVENYNVAGCITGFEPVDVLQSILKLVEQVNRGEFFVDNQYSRVVQADGNPKARALVSKYFEIADTDWRGIGVIPDSGLKLKPEYARFDAHSIDVDVEPTIENAGCRCGEILTGTILPADCPMFGKACTPENPVGACMVSSEGTCAAYHKYRDV